MPRCFLAVLAALTALSSALTDKEKAEKTLHESIKAASIVRAAGSYSNASNCVWPECAPVCEDCGSKGVGSCMIPGAQMCPWSAKCTLGSCFCRKGYCARGQECKFRTCQLGARPPKHAVSNSARRLAEFGPDLPYNATAEEWHEFVVGSTKWPFLLLLAGVVMGLLTCGCICGHCAWEPSCMPTSPIILLVLCILTVGFISFGVVSRAAVVSESFDLIGQQLRRVQKSIVSAKSLAKDLEDMASTFQAVVDDLPHTCNAMVPGAKEMMTMASDKANEKLLEMSGKVEAFSNVANAADFSMSTALAQEWAMKMLVVIGPMVPLVLMAVWTLGVAIATVVSWLSSNPKIAKRADDLVIECAAPCTCCLMMLAVLLASSYLWVGILVGGVCLNLDGNAVSLIHTVNFTELSHFKFHIDPVLEGATRYYIEGSQENPMISMIEDVERDATALYTVYTNATWATTPAEMVCDGVRNLNASDALAACTRSVGFATELMAASNIYPYYDTLGHELMCDTMLHGMTLLVFYSAVVSIVLMPLVAICADVDLRKWEAYKEANYENHYDISHEMQEKFPFLSNLHLPSPSQQSTPQGTPLPSPHGGWRQMPQMPWQH